MTHAGLATYARAPITPTPPTTAALVVTNPLEALVVTNTWLTATGRVGVNNPVVIDGSFIDARLTGKALIEIRDSTIAAMLDGTRFIIDRCRIGSAQRPDGGHDRATEDGIRPCPLPGSALPAGPSFIRDSDIINSDGRNGTIHMDGIQVWMGGNLVVERCHVNGWWQSAIMLKSDWGPIDDVLITGCYLTGAQYFQLRIIDGGHGRPTNVSIIDVVVDAGYKGGAHPINTGDDRCTTTSQTRYVRTEAERLDPTWVVYSGVVDRDGVEIPPRGGWYEG